MRKRRLTMKRLRHTPASLPRYANPWSFRPLESIEHSAGLDGRPIGETPVRRGGRLVNAPGAWDPSIGRPTGGPVRSMLAELRRRVSAEVARYRMSGLFSDKELKTIEALWLDGRPLRVLARLDGVTAQAIGDRIERVKNRAPRFYAWWRLKHRTRARRVA